MMDITDLPNMDPTKITEKEFNANIERCRAARVSWVQQDATKAANSGRKKVTSVADLGLFKDPGGRP